MNFELSREHKMISELVKSFAEKEVKPIAGEIDLNSRFPKETVEKMGKLNMLGIPIPEEYGGAGGDEIAYVLTVEELSKICATTGVICSAHTSLACGPILKYGNQDQKEKYLIPLAKGEKLGAFALTEANAGTDAGGQETIALEKEDHYLLRGTKIFITNGGVADIYIVFAMTDRGKGTRGISAFIVEKDRPGFSIGKIEDKLGIRGSSTAELIFHDCKIPKENLLGKEGQGFKIAMETLDGGRIGIGAQALGIAQGAFNETVRYLNERKQFNRPLSKFQGLQWMMADMATEIEAARLLVYKAAYNKINNLPYNKEAAMAKLYASNTAMSVTTKCVQLHGGYGYIKDYPLERMMRDAKITEIYEGTSQVQQMVIAGHVLR